MVRDVRGFFFCKNTDEKNTLSCTVVSVVWYNLCLHKICVHIFKQPFFAVRYLALSDHAARNDLHRHNNFSRGAQEHVLPAGGEY